MARTSNEDPLKVFRFTVEMGGARIGFQECSKLERDTDVSEYREGGDNATTKKSAGLTKLGDITLKRGQILDQGQNDLYDWALDVFNMASNGADIRDYRRDIDIVQYDRGGEPVVRWRAYECWPRRFAATSDMNAQSSDNSIEEMVIVNEGWEKVQV